MERSLAARALAFVRAHRSPSAAVIILVLGTALIALDLGGTWGFLLLGPLDPWWGLATLVPGCAVVAVKDRMPMTALALGSALFLADFAVLGTIGMLAVLHEVIYEATRSLSPAGRRRMLAILVATGALLVLAIAVLTRDLRPVVFAALIVFAIIGTPFWWATAVRSAEEVAELNAERAEDAARLTALREHDAVREERERMARDLHDVIAGHLSGVALRSEAALSRAPDEARDREALAVIREASVRSLEEMRAMILLLRSGEEPVAAPDRLDRLDEIVDGARDAGLEVSVEAEELGALPAAVDQAAARIVRESLLNAAKHAAGGRADVRITRRAGRLELAVRSSGGRAADAGGAGLGLASMRERAEALGGRFSAGPDADAWLVSVELPAGVGA